MRFYVLYKALENLDAIGPMNELSKSVSRGMILSIDLIESEG